MASFKLVGTPEMSLPSVSSGGVGGSLSHASALSTWSGLLYSAMGHCSPQRAWHSESRSAVSLSDMSEVFRSLSDYASKSCMVQHYAARAYS